MQEFISELFYDSTTRPNHYDRGASIRETTTVEFVETEFSQSYLYSLEKKLEYCRTSDLQVFIQGYCFLREKDSVDYAKLDANAVSELYKKHGDGFVSKIKGFFSILILDARQKLAKVYVDPFNMYPLYYYFSGKSCIISSTLPLMTKYLKSGNHSLAVDSVTVYEQLLFNVTLSNRSVIMDVRTFGAGTVSKISHAGIESSKYSDCIKMVHESQVSYSKDESLEILGNLLSKNIELYRGEPSETIYSLTGGYDSRLILAFLEKTATNFDFFSYGIYSSWDITIPEMIAKKHKLKYQSIFLEEKFQEKYEYYAKLAATEGDGTTLYVQANIPYVFKNAFPQKRNLVSGIFGSELIKYPSSRGSFLDDNMYKLLAVNSTKSIPETFRSRLSTIGISVPENIINEVVLDVVDSGLIAEGVSFQKKLYAFIYSIGAPQYFRREIMLSRKYIVNYFPLFDIDFTRALMKTPFVWMNCYGAGKSKMKNLKIHSLYAELIQKRKPSLNSFITAHGFKPGYLLHKILYPMMMVEYFTNRKGLKAESLVYEEALKMGLLSYKTKTDLQIKANNIRNQIKLKSLEMWIDENI